MKDLRGFSSFLKRYHLDAMSVENLDLAFEMEIPLIQLYAHLPRQQLIDGSRQSYELFLSTIEDGTAVDRAKENIALWEEDRIPGFAQSNLGPSDLILLYALQKKVLLKFLPEYTRNIVEVVNIIHELDAYYMEVQNLAIQALFRIKKKTSDKLVESEERYRDLIESATDMIHIASVEGQIQYANKAWLKALEYTQEEIADLTYQKVVHPDDIKTYNEERARALLGETGREFTFAFSSKSGRKIFVEGSINCQFDQGKPVSTRGIFKDITVKRVTERKLIEYLEKLKESEERFRLLVENVRDYSIFMIDTRGNILSWNAGAENISGYSAKEIIGKNISCFYMQEDKLLGEPERNLEMAIENGRYENEGWRVRKDGSKIWANIIYTPLMDKEGQLTGFVKVTRDITERKIKDERIEKTVKQLSEAQEMAHIGSWELDIESNNLSWSDELYRIYGIDINERPLKYGDYAKYNHPDDQKMVEEKMEEAKREKKPFNFDYRIIMENKTVKTLHARGIVISDSSGDAIRMSGTLQDITERRNINERIETTIRQLSQAQQMAHIGSWEWDITDNTIYWSDELYRIWGYEPQEFTPRFRGYLNFIHPEDRGKVHSIVSKAIRAHASFRLEHRIITKQGQVRIINSQGKILVDDVNKRIIMSGTAQDITERVLAKTELKRAEDMVKAKQQFLSNMSHEIRTPMNAIIGFTKVVLKTELSTKQKEYLEAIRISGDTLMVLINDILDLAKVDEGKMVFEEVPFMLSSSVKAMLQLFESKMREKNILLRKLYDQNIPKVLLGDSVRLHQIILNLMGNAVKFTNRGQIIFAARMLEEDEEKATVEFCVTDSGIGIPPDRISDIFENFQQAHSSTNRLYGGTGLGLAIVKQLVERQGGSIHVKSQVDVGSEFTFTLSFKKAPEDVAAKMMEETTHEDIAGMNIQSTRVLVVEDIPLNQLLIKTLLNDFGCEQDVADNGKIAIQKLKEKEYDIVLMDLQMPVMNGFEATEYIRQNMHLDVPIIGLTADVTTTDLDRCLASGMNDYVSKPIDEKLLYNKIMNALRKSGTPRERLEENNGSHEAPGQYTDLQYMIDRTSNNYVLMREMICLFLDQTPTFVQHIREGAETGEWEKIRAAAHSLLPSFNIVGMSREHENLVKKIQEYAREKHNSGEIKTLVALVQKACDGACHELEMELVKRDRQQDVSITSDIHY
jgi:PAS domain S-box-containing protein